MRNILACRDKNDDLQVGRCENNMARVECDPIHDEFLVLKSRQIWWRSTRFWNFSCGSWGRINANTMLQNVFWRSEYLTLPQWLDDEDHTVDTRSGERLFPGNHRDRARDNFGEAHTLLEWTLEPNYVDCMGVVYPEATVGKMNMTVMRHKPGCRPIEEGEQIQAAHVGEPCCCNGACFPRARIERKVKDTFERTNTVWTDDCDAHENTVAGWLDAGTAHVEMIIPEFTEDPETRQNGNDVVRTLRGDFSIAGSGWDRAGHDGRVSIWENTPGFISGMPPVRITAGGNNVEGQPQLIFQRGGGGDTGCVNHFDDLENESILFWGSFIGR